MTLGGLPVTKEGCKGVQPPKEQTLLLLLSILILVPVRRGLQSGNVGYNLLRD